jgi:hypothetical protein
MKQGNLKPSTVTKIIGIVLLVSALLITLFIQCPTKMHYFMIYAFVGIGIALLLARSAEHASLSVKAWNIGVGLTGGVALPFILFFTNPVGSFKPDNCIVRQSVTVFVHGKKGKQNMILRQKGYVILDVQSERKMASINENGQAHFQNLQVGDHVRLNIDFSEPYRSINPDSVYTIDEGGNIYLPVALEGIDNVKGNVLYDDKPLPGVTVKIEMLSATTDSTGFFSIPIPDSLQTARYIVWFFKDGFKSISKDALPQSGIPLSVVMEK